MSEATEHTMDNIMRDRTRKPIPDGTAKPIYVKCNAKLYNAIIAITNERRRNISNTVRLLLYMGIEQYGNNQAAGVKTTPQARQQKAKQAAEAQAIAARRAQEKQRKRNRGKAGPVEAVTPLLYGTEPGEEGSV